MKVVVVALLIFVSTGFGFAQQHYADSLKQVLLSSKADSAKVVALAKLSTYYSVLYPDSGLYYADSAINISIRNNYKYGEVLGLLCKGASILKKGDFTGSIQLAFKILEQSRELEEHRLSMLSKSHQFIGEIYAVTFNPEEAANNLYKAVALQKQSGEYRDDFYGVYFSLAFTMLIQDKKDSAIFFLRKGSDLLTSSGNKKDVQPWIVSGNVYRQLGDLQKAEEYFRQGIKLGNENNSLFFVAAISNDLAGLFYQTGRQDSCIQYLHRCLFLSQKYHYKVFEMFSSGLLYYIYDESHRADSALKYVKIHLSAKDEAFNQEKVKQFQSASFEAESRENELQNAKTKYESSLRMYTAIGAAIIFLGAAFFLYRSNRNKQRSNTVLAQQKETVERTLDELRSTQVQLIQAEKMASLGELTAGIAHEIQNPLNFVNNFSELSNELIDEMNAELEKGDIHEARVISNDVKQNLEKITHHGKRADAIVKSMLQHSRTSTGKKEPTDINALCDEYLRLSYHGLRAKDKLFNATFNADFDTSFKMINVVSQDIGRVILNLLTNAFYAVNEKRRIDGQRYEPTVSISTKKMNENIEIRITDNGNGIPEKVLSKIFQPFFTTKPTGQGTGLGLSLSYDIVKAHEGKLSVETRQGEGSTFTIFLPV